ncbi:MAG: hypothetical protein WAN36_01705, partial [Calditrichia bacterium]
MNFIKSNSILGFALIGLLGVSLAWAQYEVPRSVFGNGGGISTNSSYRMIGTLGQQAIGITANSANMNKAGFWYTVWIPDFHANLTISDNCGNLTELVFGTAADAGDGFDPLYDLLAPAPPAAGAFDARLRSPVDDFLKDFRRRNIDTTIIWEVYFQAAAGCDPITLTWDNTQLPDSGSFRLKDMSGTSIDMRMQSSHIVGNPAITQMQIVYSFKSFFDQEYAAGWDMLGLPLEVNDPYYLTVYPDAIAGTCYG